MRRTRPGSFKSQTFTAAASGRALNGGPLVDRDAVWALKRRALDLLWREQGPDLRFARWREAHVVATTSESDRAFVSALGADEVLDYRAAVERYRGRGQIVIEGGDHGLSDFAAHLDAVFDHHERKA